MTTSVAGRVTPAGGRDTPAGDLGQRSHTTAQIARNRHEGNGHALLRAARLS